MIYLDTSVLLAELLAEDRRPAAVFWETGPEREPFMASRLLVYECWTRIHARGLAGSHGDAVRAWLSRLALVELVPPVLARATEPFPLPVRTLDALHLASMVFLRTRGLVVRLATYDQRQAEVARAMGFEVVSMNNEQ